MSLSRFINFDSIASSNTKVLGRTIPDNIIKSLSYNEGIIENFSIEDSSVDIHLYNNSNEYIKSVYNQKVEFDSEYSDIYYNITELFFNLSINSGLFKLCLNFSLDLFGNSGFKPLILKEVSPDLSELKLKIPSKVLTEFPKIKDQFKEFDFVVSNLINFGRVNNLSIDFGKNIKQTIVNIKTECTEDYIIYVKLLNGLDGEIDINDPCHMSFKLCEDYVDSFLVSPLNVEVKPNSLKPPNFNVPYNIEGGDSTSFKSWDVLLESNETTTNDILQLIVSSSTSIPLNIDYTDFENFVFYGSAQERLKNYDYKRRLISYYNTNIISSSVSSSFYGNVNNIKFKNKIRNIKGTFDPFEQWLQEESGSLFTHDITGSQTPSPKFTNSGKNYLYDVTSSQYQSWFSASTEIASRYDSENSNRLYEYTPGHIVNNTNNSEYILFLEMVGHHFDNIYSYIKELTSVHSKDEHPKRGIPNKLLKEYAESLGWDIKDGYQLSDLWLYKLGTDSSGSVDSLNVLPSLAREDLSNQIWRRVVNNLPILLKTKGTARSVKALMSSYGIPKTLISIKEYGGPTTTNFTSYKEENSFNYALELGSDKYVEMPVYPVLSTGSLTYEFRFKTNYSSSVSMSLWSIEDKDTRDVLHNLEMISYLSESTSSYSGSYSYGKLRYTGTYYSASTYYTSSEDSEYLPIFDNDFWNVQIKSNDYLSDTIKSSSISIGFMKTSDYTFNRISFSSSFDWVPTGETNYTFGVSSSLFFGNSHYLLLGGSTGSNYTRFSGSVQSYKEYAEILDDSTFEDHTVNPLSYTSIDYSSSYEDVVRYFPLGGDVIRYNHTSSTTVQSSHPNRNNLTSHSISTFHNFTGDQSDQYSGNNETVYVKIPSTGANIEKSNKVRIEDNSTTGYTLSPTKRVEESSFDRSSKDTNRLIIAYSPTDQINRDIYNQMGYFSLDNILGNPKDHEKNQYTGFDQFREQYWKKYTAKNNFNKYIEVFSLFNFTFFDQIKQLVPARSNLISGVLIENTILERPRIERKNPSISYNQLEDSIITRSDRQIGKYTLHTASIDYDKELDIYELLEEGSITLEKDVKIEHLLEEGELDLNKEFFINDVYYSGSVQTVLNFLHSENTSSISYFKTSNDYKGSYNLIQQFVVGDSIYPTFQNDKTKASLNIHSITSTITSHTNSGSLSTDLNVDYLKGVNGVYKTYTSSSALKKYTGLTSERIGVEYIERQKEFLVKRNGELIPYTRTFNETDEYILNIESYTDKPYKYVDLDNRVGFIKDFNYEEYYSNNFTGSAEVTSSLMDIKTTMTSSLLYDFIKRYNYFINSDGHFYKIKNNGSLQVYITGSVTHPFYKSKEYFYSSSNDYNNRFIYNYVDVSVSMSKGEYYSSSNVDSSYQYYYDSVYNRARFEGSRLEGPGINIDTVNTIDGGPVVTVIEVNSSNLIV